MRMIRAKDYGDMSRLAAHIVDAQVMLNPRSVLGLATGSSPLGVYGELIARCREGELDFSGVRTVNLDEYVGLGPGDEQSYRRFMDDNLFDHINIRKENTHVPNGLAEDAGAECARYDGIIDSLGGMDLQLLGIGHNGHIGFNEPAEDFAVSTHRVALAERTIQANRRFFQREDQVPRHAYTMGIGSIMRARRILLVASGEDKAEILARAICGPVTPRVPASVLRLHADVTVVADEAALSRLPQSV